MYDKALMDVEDDIHACLAPLPVLFLYIVSTDVDIRFRFTDLDISMNHKHTFYHCYLVIDYSKPEGLVSDGRKEADFG
jgi:hypothetical protein